MAVKIRSKQNIEGIKILETCVKISQLSDDTTIFLKDEDSINPLLELLNLFKEYSGLKANVEKTKAYKIGKEQVNNTFNLLWPKDDNKLLGITITDKEKTNIKENFKPKLNKMHSLIRIWNTRNLSLKGKIVVIN